MTMADDPPQDGLTGVSGDGAHLFLCRATLALIDKASVVAFLCGDNRFDADFLMREGQAQGLPPSFVLSRIRVARMFTMHQLAASVRSRLNRLLSRENVSGLMVSGIVPLFSEERIPRREAERLLEETLGSLDTLVRTYHLPCLLSLPERTGSSLPVGSLQRQAEAACTRILRFDGSAEATL